MTAMWCHGVCGAKGSGHSNKLKNLEKGSKNISPHEIKTEIEKIILNQTALIDMGKKCINMMSSDGVVSAVSFLAEYE